MNQGLNSLNDGSNNKVWLNSTLKRQLFIRSLSSCNDSKLLKSAAKGLLEVDLAAGPVYAQ